MPKERTQATEWSRKELNVPNLENILKAADKKDISAQKKATEDLPFVPYSQVYQKQNKTWKHIGFKCHGCDKVIKSQNVIINHKNVCKRLNTLYTEIDVSIVKENNMPIQTLTIKGEKYYRWGDQGKLYKNRQDAEKQAQAAYASGYKEKKDMPKK